MQDVKDQVDNLIPKTTLFDDGDRRTFLKVALGTGFAAAVMPVTAQTIHTDTAGLTAGEVKINVHGYDVRAYRAQPEGKKDLPVIIVISEIFGVHEHIADVARRWAKLGYLAIAPDLFARQGDPAKYESVAELQAQVITKVPDAQVISDLDGVVAWAKDHGGNPAKVGISGFCWGGRFVWLYSAHNPKVKAGVAWYGKLVGEKSALQPVQPVEIAPTLTVPVLGLYGGADNGIPVATVEQMKAALAKGHSHAEIVIYPDVGHAFNADYRPSYVESAAKDSWQRAVSWFKQHGVS
ncbi:MAG: carboxymethylenebutenolidase [Herbaspirillum sp.]|jgi:carboxymethylenebutenolidase|nr:carboxymethylenebutenolidase [Herbaspirillum sp.]